MINPEEDPPQLAKKLLIPPPLDLLGVAELQQYIATLETEISRVKATILAKEAHKSAAAAFFRTPGGQAAN